jgi:DNA-binding transcriptional LysR family regulator
MLIRHLSYFVTLARMQHYARAAAACNIAQPTLSAAIRKLEEDLQVHLVVRGHRFIGLTQDGEKVLQWGQRILADYASLQEGLSGSHRGLTGTLRLGVIPAAMPAVAFLTALFSAAHPVVTIDIRSMTSRAIQHGIDNFEIECGLTYLDNEALQNVRQVPLYRERYVFITKRGNRYADRESMTWAEAVQERLCLPNEDMQNRRIIDKIAASAGLRIGASVVTNSFAGMCSHLIQGEWSSIVPHMFPIVLGRPLDLVTIPLVEPFATQSIGLVISSRDPLSPIAGALMDTALKADFDEELAVA